MKFVDSPKGVKVSLTGEVKKLCPFKNEVDAGVVQIAWTTGLSTVELHSLREYLDGFESLKVSHEGFVHEVYWDLVRAVRDVTVRATFTTAGFPVVVET